MKAKQTREEKILEVSKVFSQTFTLILPSPKQLIAAGFAHIEYASKKHA